MQKRNAHTLQRLFGNHQILMHFIELALGVGLYALILLTPIPRQIGLTFRYEFASMLLVSSVLFLLAFSLPGWIGKITGLLGTLFIFAMPLSGLWSSGVSEPVLLSGLLPFSDANGYYIDAQRILNGQLFSSFSARRPMFSALLGVLLGLTGQNLQCSLAILVFITALSCYLAAREVQKTNGTIAGVFLIVFLFQFYRRFIGTTMTENLGFPMGVLSLALFWNGTREKNRWVLLLGVFMLSMALNARAGAFIILPLILIWGAWITAGKRRLSWSFIILGAIAIVLGFAVNLVIFRLFSPEGMMPFSNFSYTLYGITVGGKGWLQFRVDHPEVMLLSEPQLSREVYRIAFEEFLANPMNSVAGVFKMWKLLFSTSTLGAFGFVGGADAIITFASDSGENKGVHVAFRILLFFLSAVGLFSSFKKKEQPDHLLVLASFFGIFLSVPIVPLWDGNGMRVYASTIPLQMLIPMTGLCFLFEKVRISLLTHRPDTDFTGTKEILTVSIILLLLVSIGPLLVKAFSTEAVLSEGTCEPGDELIYMRINPGSYINITPDEPDAVTWLPDISHNRFNKSIHDFMYNEIVLEMDAIGSPMTVMNGFDLKSGKEIILVTDTALISGQDGNIVEICGKTSTNPDVVSYGFFYASEIHHMDE